MTERKNIVLIGGEPGSGKTRLGRTIGEILPNSEHISIGNTVRAIGARALWSAHTDEIVAHLSGPHPEAPLPDELIKDIVSERLSDASEIDTVLLDGYPRYPAQVMTCLAIARSMERNVIGMLLTVADEPTQLKRMTAREGARHITSANAKIRLRDSRIPLRQTRRLLEDTGIGIDIVDTTGPREHTAAMGLFLADQMLDRTV